jgi:hypothetical protein
MSLVLRGGCMMVPLGPEARSLARFVDDDGQEPVSVI